MPIRPEERARYPKDWPAISLRIRSKRAANRCECEGECGEDHRADPLNSTFDPDDPRCAEMNGEEHSITGSVVVLTVAHLDHTPENCGDDNLKAMCQRCHLRYDREHHRQTRRSRLAVGDLLTQAPDSAR